MAKVNRTVTTASTSRAVNGSKSRSRSGGKAAAGARGVAEAGRAGWATDLVFDVREPKLAVSLRLDADVLRFFRGFGSGYQTRINEVLKAFMQARGGVEAAPRVPGPRASRNGASNGSKRAAR
jgi:uncharacterized protein (DUF4415 family)